MPFINVYNNMCSGQHKDEEAARRGVIPELRDSYEFTLCKKKDGSWIEINLLTKLALVLVFLLPIPAKASCYCACVNGEKQPICDGQMGMEPMCMGMCGGAKAQEFSDSPTYPQRYPE